MQTDYMRTVNSARDVTYAPEHDVPGYAREFTQERLAHIASSFERVHEQMTDAGESDEEMLITAVSSVQELIAVDQIEGMRVMAAGHYRGWGTRGRRLC